MKSIREIIDTLKGLVECEALTDPSDVEALERAIKILEHADWYSRAIEGATS